MRIELIVRGALVVACLAGAVVSLIVYRSNHLIAGELETGLLGHVDPGSLGRLEDARTPLNPDSLRDSYKAIALTRLGRGAEAERVMLGAARREPENALVWATLSRVQVTAGKRAAARESYRRVFALNSQTPRSLEVPPPLPVGP